jgi:hypothetical protein
MKAGSRILHPAFVKQVPLSHLKRRTRDSALPNSGYLAVSATRLLERKDGMHRTLQPLHTLRRTSLQILAQEGAININLVCLDNWVRLEACRYR